MEQVLKMMNDTELKMMYKETFNQLKEACRDANMTNTMVTLIDVILGKVESELANRGVMTWGQFIEDEECGECSVQ